MKIITAILIIGALTVSASADEAEVDATYFHPAAHLYIQGDTAAASNLVARGLSVHPNDGKLKRLKDLLEEQEQEGGNNQQQDQQDSQNQQQENPDAPEGSPEEEKEEDAPQQPEQPDEPSPEQPQEQDSDPAEEAEPEQAEQMTEDEARQLLDAMRQEEKNKRLQLHPVMGAPVKVEKDW